jgi:hypothetical protein
MTQEIGRLGRNNEPSRHVTLVWRHYLFQLQSWSRDPAAAINSGDSSSDSNTGPSICSAQPILDYCSSERNSAGQRRCLRQKIDTHLKADAQTCIGMGGVRLCDHCEENMTNCKNNGTASLFMERDNCLVQAQAPLRMSSAAQEEVNEEEDEVSEVLAAHMRNRHVEEPSSEAFDQMDSDPLDFENSAEVKSELTTPRRERTRRSGDDTKDNVAWSSAETIATPTEDDEDADDDDDFESRKKNKRPNKAASSLLVNLSSGWFSADSIASPVAESASQIMAEIKNLRANQASHSRTQNRYSNLTFNKPRNTVTPGTRNASSFIDLTPDEENERKEPPTRVSTNRSRVQSSTSAATARRTVTSSTPSSDANLGTVQEQNPPAQSAAVQEQSNVNPPREQFCEQSPVHTGGSHTANQRAQPAAANTTSRKRKSGDSNQLAAPSISTSASPEQKMQTASVTTRIGNGVAERKTQAEAADQLKHQVDGNMCRYTQHFQNRCVACCLLEYNYEHVCQANRLCRASLNKCLKCWKGDHFVGKCVLKQSGDGQNNINHSALCAMCGLHRVGLSETLQELHQQLCGTTPNPCSDDSQRSAPSPRSYSRKQYMVHILTFGYFLLSLPSNVLEKWSEIVKKKIGLVLPINNDPKESQSFLMTTMTNAVLPQNLQDQEGAKLRALFNTGYTRAFAIFYVVMDALEKQRSVRFE